MMVSCKKMGKQTVDPHEWICLAGRAPSLFPQGMETAAFLMGKALLNMHRNTSWNKLRIVMCCEYWKRDTEKLCEHEVEMPILSGPLQRCLHQLPSLPTNSKGIWTKMLFSYLFSVESGSFLLWSSTTDRRVSSAAAHTGPRSGSGVLSCAIQHKTRSKPKQLVSLEFYC